MCVCVCVYPKVGQLQSYLNEGVRAGPALLDQTLPKVVERDDDDVDIISQRLGPHQRVTDHGLALKHNITTNENMFKQLHLIMFERKTMSKCVCVSVCVCE